MGYAASGFLESAAIADAFVTIDPAKSLPAAKANKQQTFKFPALIPEELSVRNLHFTVLAPGEDTVIKNFDLLLAPGQKSGGDHTAEGVRVEVVLKKSRQVGTRGVSH